MGLQGRVLSRCFNGTYWREQSLNNFLCKALSSRAAALLSAGSPVTVQCQPSCQPSPSPSQPALPLPIVISAAEFLWVSFPVLSGSSQGTAEHGGFLLSVPLELNLGDSHPGGSSSHGCGSCCLCVCVPKTDAASERADTQNHAQTHTVDVRGRTD